MFYPHEKPDEELQPPDGAGEYDVLFVDIIGAHNCRFDLFSPHFGHVISSSGTVLE